MALTNTSTFRDGYQPFSRQTFAPLSEGDQFSGSFTQKPSSAAPSDATPSVPGSAGQMAPSSGARPAPPTAAPTGTVQTFAQMQAQGIPRPAPPPAAPGGPMGGATYGALQQSVLQALGNPSRYGAPEVQAQFSRLAQDIDDEFTQKQRGVDEQMAARGLYDSTLAGGQLSDLNVARRSAKTDLAQRLADSQAQTYGQDRAAAIAQALGLFGQEQQGSQFDRDLDYRQKGQENSTLMQLLQALGGGSLGSLGDVGSLGGGLGGYLGDLIPQAAAGTLGPSVGGVGGPGGFGFSPSGPSLDRLPTESPAMAPSAPDYSMYGRGSTAGTIGQRAGEATVLGYNNGQFTGDSSGLYGGANADVLDQARQATYDWAGDPENEQRRRDYLISRYYGGDQSPLIVEQMRELGLL